MKTLLFLPFAILTATLASCASHTDWSEGARIVQGSEFGYGTENGDHPPYRSDARTVAMVRSVNGYAGSPKYLQYGSRPYGDSRVQYNRSPYGGGVDTRSYRNVYPAPVYPGYGYPGYGYPGYGYPGYGRW